jgi:hypothetical protein
MSKKVAQVITTLVLFMTLPSTALLAQCVDQPRNVALDKKNTIPLKSYLCSTGSGADTIRFRVEYFRLTDVAASVLLANSSSIKLKKTLGSAKLIANDVSRTYADLVKQFGSTREIPNDSEQGSAIFNLTPPGTTPADGDSDADTGDQIGTKKLRTLLGLDGPNNTNYPANDEIAALRKKVIPANLSYYYSSSEPADNDDQGCDKQDIVCAKFGKSTLTMRFWRHLTLNDIDNFTANTKVYNTRLLQVRKDKSAAKDDYITSDAFEASEFKLAKFLANGTLPEDFLPMLGDYQVGSCGTDDLPGLAGWNFSVVPRIATINAIRLENVSQQPITLGEILGDKRGDPGLQAVIPQQGTTTNATLIDTAAVTIAPGQSIIEFTNITFSIDPEVLSEFRKFREARDAIHSSAGANGFSGNVNAFQSPDPKNYTYGPAMAVTGAVVNSVHVDFTSSPAPNFVNLTIGNEAGSCPYLLSWNEADREWISHGKILHKGQGRANTYTESRTFSDLRTHFRIEEREPEIAHLQRETLTIKFRDGSSQSFLPDRLSQPLETDRPMTLLWGEAAEFSFAIPDSVKQGDVVETRLDITGYYDRYSNLPADAMLSNANPLPVRMDSSGPNGIRIKGGSPIQ